MADKQSVRIELIVDTKKGTAEIKGLNRVLSSLPEKLTAISKAGQALPKAVSQVGMSAGKIVRDEEKRVIQLEKLERRLAQVVSRVERLRKRLGRAPVLSRAGERELGVSLRADDLLIAMGVGPRSRAGRIVRETERRRIEELRAVEEGRRNRRFVGQAAYTREIASLNVARHSGASSARQLAGVARRVAEGDLDPAFARVLRRDIMANDPRLEMMQERRTRQRSVTRIRQDLAARQAVLSRGDLAGISRKGLGEAIRLQRGGADTQVIAQHIQESKAVEKSTAALLNNNKASQEAIKNKEKMARALPGLASKLRTVERVLLRLGVAFLAFRAFRFFENLAGEALRFLKVIEQMKLGFAETLSVSTRLVDRITNEQLPAQLQIQASYNDANIALKEILQTSIDFGVPAEKIAEAFAVTAGAARSGGIAMKDSVNIISQLVVLAERVQIPFNVLARDVRDIFTGLNVQRTILGNLLGLDQSRVREWRKQGILGDELIEKLRFVGETMKDNVKTYQGLRNSITSIIQDIQLQAGQGMFGVIKEELTVVRQYLLNVRSNAGMMKELSKSAENFAKSLVNAASTLYKMLPLIKGLLFAWGGFKIGGLIQKGYSGITGILGSAGSLAAGMALLSGKIALPITLALVAAFGSDKVTRIFIKLGEWLAVGFEKAKMAMRGEAGGETGWEEFNRQAKVARGQIAERMGRNPKLAEFTDSELMEILRMGEPRKLKGGEFGGTAFPETTAKFYNWLDKTFSPPTAGELTVQRTDIEKEIKQRLAPAEALQREITKMQPQVEKFLGMTAKEFSAISKEGGFTMYHPGEGKVGPYLNLGAHEYITKFTELIDQLRQLGTIHVGEEVEDVAKRTSDFLSTGEGAKVQARSSDLLTKLEDYTLHKVPQAQLALTETIEKNLETRFKTIPVEENLNALYKAQLASVEARVHAEILSHDEIAQMIKDEIIYQEDRDKAAKALNIVLGALQAAVEQEKIMLKLKHQEMWINDVLLGQLERENALRRPGQIIRGARAARAGAIGGMRLAALQAREASPAAMAAAMREVSTIEIGELQAQLGDTRGEYERIDKVIGKIQGKLGEAVQRAAGLNTESSEYKVEQASIEAYNQRIVELDATRAEALAKVLGITTQIEESQQRTTLEIEKMTGKLMNIGPLLRNTLGDSIETILFSTENIGESLQKGLTNMFQSAIKQMIRSTINQKVNLDKYFETNMLRWLPGMSGKGGEKAGKSTIQGMMKGITGKSGGGGGGGGGLQDMVIGKVKDMAINKVSGWLGGGSGGVTSAAGGAAGTILSGSTGGAVGTMATGGTGVGLASGGGLTGIQGLAGGANMSMAGGGTGIGLGSGGGGIAMGVAGGALRAIPIIGWILAALQIIIGGSMAGQKVMKQMRQAGGFSQNQMLRAGSRAALTKGFGLGKEIGIILSYLQGADNPIIKQIMKLVGMGTQKTTGTLQSRSLYRLFGEMGYPVFRHPNLNQWGFSSAAWIGTGRPADLRGQERLASGFGAVYRRMVPRGKGKYNAQATGNMVLNWAQAAGLSGEDARKILMEATRGTAGETLEKALVQLESTSRREYAGAFAPGEKLLGVGAILEAYLDLPEAVDKARLATELYGTDGRMHIERLKRVVGTLNTAFGAVGGYVTGALASGDLFKAGQDMGQSLMDGLLSRIQDRMLAQGVIGDLATDLGIMLNSAAEKFVMGDVTGGNRQLLAARTEADRLQRIILGNLGPFFASIQGFGGAFGLTPQGPGLINQTGIGSPGLRSYHTPTVTTVPGVPGQPSMGVVHGGEEIRSPASQDKLATIMEQVRDVLLSQGRGDVDGLRVVINIDGKQLAGHIVKATKQNTLSKPQGLQGIQ